ncbi:probable salivary secreted peptide [Anopheles aquasalis]|uniref:probable salivary secreted peptide n=1 Tax=Anopheles aquasalis TaxID=42839 RepID=UPI00215B1789|nr:probable salivary secreted peptide [Anopheles aquasalis]
MKGITVIVALLMFGCLVASQSHNYFWGVRDPRDVLLNRTIAVRSGTILQVKSIDLVYPLKGQQGRNISAISVVDQYINGNGGYASLYAGGIGYNYTTVHLKSQRGHGYNFIVEIYGR